MIPSRAELQVIAGQILAYLPSPDAQRAIAASRIGSEAGNADQAGGDGFFGGVGKDECQSA